MKEHFVTFYSPGTFISETSKKDIEEWDVPTAISMSKDIEERHGAIPYGFRFSTRGSKQQVIETSGFYYLGGEVFTLAQIKERNDPADATLIWNMEVNGYEKVVVNVNSYTLTMPFGEDDVVLCGVKC